MKTSSLSLVLAFVSVAWLGALLVVPPLGATHLAFVLTLGLIGVNTFASVRVLLKQGRILIVLNLLQPALFCVLSYQVYLTFGAEHFQFDREPRVWDWVAYTLAHLLRAVDLCDALEAYGIHLQPITHNSVGTGLILVALHLVADLFVLVLLVRLWELWRRRRPEPVRPPHEIQTWQKLAAASFVGLLLSGTAYAVIAAVQRWSIADLFLWPLDNIVRTLDAGDVMQIFHWKLDSVEGGYLLATVAVVFRLSLGVILGVLIQRGWVWALRGVGMTVDSLCDQLKKGIDPGATAEALARFGPQAGPAAPLLLEALATARGEELKQVLAALDRIEPEWHRSRVTRAVPLLLRARAGDGGWRAAEDIERAFVRMGRHAVPPLVAELRGTLPDWHKREFLGGIACLLLGSLQGEASEAVPVLVEILQDVECQNLHVWAAQTLGAIGPAASAAIPALTAAASAHWNHDLQTSASEALQRIRGEE